MVAEPTFDATMEELRGLAANTGGGHLPPDPPRLDPPSENGDSPGMEPIAALEARVGRVEAGVEGLRHSQALGFGAVLGAIGLFGGLLTAVVFYVLQDMGGTLRDMNGRFDRFLERQADTASAANARFDRLLEQRAAQPAAPIVIQLPVPPSAREPAPPPPG